MLSFSLDTTFSLGVFDFGSDSLTDCFRGNVSLYVKFLSDCFSDGVGELSVSIREILISVLVVESSEGCDRREETDVLR